MATLKKYPCPKTVKVDIQWVNAAVGRAAHNVFYIQSPGSNDQVSQPDVGSISGIVAPATAGVSFQRLLPYINQNWKINRITVSDNGGGTAINSASVNWVGTSAGVCLPPNNAFVLSFPINRRYRGGHPRMYLPGVDNTHITINGGGGIDNTSAANLCTAMQNAIDDITAGIVETHNLVVGTVAYASNKVALQPSVFYQYQSVHMHERIGTQRRRLGKESAYTYL